MKNKNSIMLSILVMAVLLCPAARADSCQKFKELAGAAGAIAGDYRGTAPHVFYFELHYAAGIPINATVRLRNRVRLIEQHYPTAVAGGGDEDWVAALAATREAWDAAWESEEAVEAAEDVWWAARARSEVGSAARRAAWVRVEAAREAHWEDVQAAWEATYAACRSGTTAVDENLKAIQAMLNDCGFKAGPVDGLWGRKTESAAAEYVKAHGGTPSSERSSLLAQVDGNRIGDSGPCPKAATAQNAGAAVAALEKTTPVQETDDQSQGRDVETALKILENRKGDPDDNPLDLGGLDLAGGDFSGRDFGKDDLSGTDLQGADMTGTDLSDTKLGIGFVSSLGYSKRTNLKDAILDRANLVGQDLRETVVEGASLAGAALTGARFSPASGLTLAQASVAKWTGETVRRVQDKAIEDLQEAKDKVFSVAVDEDGSFRLGAPKYFKP